MADIECGSGGEHAFARSAVRRTQRRPVDESQEVLITHPFRLAGASAVSWALIIAAALPFIR